MQPVMHVDGTLTVPDAPPRPSRVDFASDEAFGEATARRDAFMAERRKLQKWLHEQGRDRTGRASPEG